MTRTCGLLLLLSAALPAAEFAGKWSGTMTPPDARARAVSLTIQDRDGVLSGSLAMGPDATPVAIQKVEFDGPSLSFQVSSANQDVTFELKLESGVLSGFAISAAGPSRVRLTIPPAAGTERVGGGVTGPTLIHKVEPAYSEEARHAGVEGTVRLYVQINPEGKAVNMRVLHSLGGGLDEKAMEAVAQWRFNPGMKDGKPVTVEAQIEVNFRLLKKPPR
jgi:TonB family protein